MVTAEPRGNLWLSTQTRQVERLERSGTTVLRHSGRFPVKVGHLYRYLVAHTGSLIVLSGLVLGSVGLQIYRPQAVRRFIDLAAAKAPILELVQIAVMYATATCFMHVMAGTASWLAAKIGWRVTNELRSDVFQHVLKLDIAYHRERMPGEMVERIDGDASSLSDLFAQFLVRAATALLSGVSVLILLWRENTKAGMVLTAVALVAAAILYSRRDTATEVARAERESSGQLFGYIEERLTAMDDLRANGAGEHVMRGFYTLQRDWYLKSVHAWWRRSTLWLISSSISSAGLVAALGLGIGLYLGGAITIGTVYLFYSYMTMLEWPLEQISEQFQLLQRAKVGAQRISELLEIAPEVRDGGPAVLSRGPHAVEFQDVRFAYGQTEVLKGISFRLEPGETLGIVGRTGSGKSTLVRLLARLLDPTAGRISIDAYELGSVATVSFRREVSLVTQSVHVLPGTLRDNITLFDRSISDSRIEEAIDSAGLRSFVRRYSLGLDTKLGSGGCGVSAGEEQLITYIRGLVNDPGLVILDEPSSRLDGATERLVAAAMERVLRGRTAIVIAHRPETIRRVDKLLVLDCGATVAFGRRDAIVESSDPRYRSALMMAFAESEDATQTPSPGQPA